MTSSDNIGNSLIIISVMWVVALCCFLNVYIQWYAWIGIGLCMAWAIIMWQYHSQESIRLQKKKLEAEIEILEERAYQMHRKKD